MGRLDQQSLLDPQELESLNDLMSHRTANQEEGIDTQNNIEAREEELNQTPLGKVNDFFKQIKFD